MIMNYLPLISAMGIMLVILAFAADAVASRILAREGGALGITRPKPQPAI